MARTTTQLTDTAIRAEKGSGKERILSDGNGLQLRIMPNGTKSWRLLYKNPVTNKPARLSLGTYPNLTLANARKKTIEVKELVAQGIDPKAHRAAKLEEAHSLRHHTFINVARDWFEVKKSEVSPDYANDIWRSLELHIFPELADTHISEITAPMVINTLRPLEAKGSLESVRRVVQRANEVMTYGVNTGLVHSNPLSGIKAAFKAPKKENMKSIPPSALPELMETLSFASIKLPTRCLIEFELHTLVRPNEAAGARWAEFDFSQNLWIIPAERMKKKKREHRVPLTPQVLEILERMKPYSGHREHVFPGDRDPKRSIGSQTANAALKRMGYKNKLVAHGLRSIGSTALNEKGFEPDLIESALAHIDKNEVRRAYNRSDFLERRREVMSWWSQTIEQASNKVSR